jgi:hypothetical protein
MGVQDAVPAKGPLVVGTVAPDFTLHLIPDQTHSLHELHGNPIILAFYPGDWRPNCGDQMALYNEVLPELRNSARRCWAFQWTVRGVIEPLPTRRSFTFRCSRSWNMATTSARHVVKPTATQRCVRSDSVITRRLPGMRALIVFACFVDALQDMAAAPR